MNTLTLKEAAGFLKMHPEVLRSRAKRGVIPGARAGRRWVFLESDLADYLRSLYPLQRQALRVTKEKSLCHYANAAEPSGLTSPVPTDNEYVDLLGLPIEPSRKSSTTS